MLYTNLSDRFDFYCRELQNYNSKNRYPLISTISPEEKLILLKTIENYIRGNNCRIFYTDMDSIRSQIHDSRELSLETECDGFYVQKNISINEKLGLTDKICSLLHETVHLYQDINHKLKHFDNVNKAKEEIFTEAVAMLILGSFGIEDWEALSTSNLYHSDYNLRKNCLTNIKTNVINCAHQIINDLEAKLEIEPVFGDLAEGIIRGEIFPDELEFLLHRWSSKAIGEPATIRLKNKKDNGFEL
jgi:hypothetical protein